MQTLEHLLTGRELAELLRVDRRTIRVWTHQGILPAIHIGTKTRRYDLQEVRRALGMGTSNAGEAL